MPAWIIILLTGSFTLGGTIVGGIVQILAKRAEIKMKKADIKGQLRRDSVEITLKLMEKYGIKLSQGELKNITDTFKGISSIIIETEKGIMNDD